LFADDVELYVRASDYNDLETFSNKLTELAKQWQLTISIDRCNVLIVGKVNFSGDLSIEGYLLPSVTSCHDLG